MVIIIACYGNFTVTPGYSCLPTTKLGMNTTYSGGAGNAVRSPSRPAVLAGGEPLLPGSERGRTVGPREPSVDRITHAGRGGAGNTRSPSTNGRIDLAKEEALEQKVLAERRGRELAADIPISTGRGGAGNIGGSRSRSRQRRAGELTPERLGYHKDVDVSRTTTRTSSAGNHGYVSGGRGGYGNIIPEADLTPEERAKREAEARQEAAIWEKHRQEHSGGLHSSGKGGYGNLAPVVSNDIDLSSLSLEEQEARAKLHTHDHGFMTGKGGAGNYHSKPPIDENGRGRDSNRSSGGGLMQNIFRSLSRSTGRKE
ncbi:hypothetical protein QFC22_003021 [Naganishia vaughanmartiniae]|uniref:Uncharacterized protein n=1 Tax=Naganishia vaughanmartiniae TaxID=1424756 RepID=A0ACC2X930_9TREE|nr:hypothetical protein QFC22_003021 [Naganishia vaughanmartiniae]